MSDTSRIPLLEPGEARQRADALGISAQLAELSVFRIVLHQPEVAAALSNMLDALLWNGRLDPRLRELIIMRIGWATGSTYEWTQHWGVARMLDVPESDLLALRDWRRADHLGATERAVLAATDETLERGEISTATWDACRHHLGDDPAMLVELVTAIGNWRLFSSLLRSLDVPLEEGVAPWPPDGIGPDR